ARLSPDAPRYPQLPGARVLPEARLRDHRRASGLAGRRRPDLPPHAPGLADHRECALDVGGSPGAPGTIVVVRRERLFVARRELGDDPLLDLVDGRAGRGFL